MFRRLGQGRGFSFIELLVVTSIILVLAGAAMPLARITIQRQREIELRRALRELRTAIDKYKDAVDQGQIGGTDNQLGSEGYPPDLETLVEGVTAAGDASGRKLKFLRRDSGGPDDAVAGMGAPVLPGRARRAQLGRQERVRRVLAERGHGARWDEIP